MLIILNNLSSVGIGVALSKFVKTFGGPLEKLSGMFDSIGGIADNIGNILDQVGKSLNSTVPLVKVAWRFSILCRTLHNMLYVEQVIMQSYCLTFHY